MKVIATLVLLLVAAPAFAKHEGSHPCKAVKSACEAAGFKKGDHKDGKGLWVDCIDKVMKGEPVAGVTVAAADIEGCKAKKAEHEKK